MSRRHRDSGPALLGLITPTRRLDRDALEAAARELGISHAGITVESCGERDELVIGAMSELQLEAFCEDLVEKSGIKIERSAFRVVYLETIRRAGDAEGRFIRRAGGKGQYAQIKIGIAPLEGGTGFQFENAIIGEALPKQYLNSVEEGILTALEGGVLAGYEMVDVKVTLYDGSYHEQDSSEIAFKIAASMAFKEAAKKASPVLLEPVMSVEVAVPEDFLGTIVGDLNRRRGRIEGMEHRPGLQVVKAVAPLAELLGYRSELRELAQERAECTIQFLRREQVPRLGAAGEHSTGVPANKPVVPKLGRGSAAADLPSE